MLLVCFAGPRPLWIAVILILVAVGLEATQALTPDHRAATATALVAPAALVMDLVLSWRTPQKSGDRAVARQS